jgi:gliding motility-associated-like protein
LISGTVTSSTIDVQFNSPLAQYITLTASDYGGKCSTTETILINVVAPPLSYFYVKPDICVYDTVVVALSYRSPSATSFNWDFAGANMVAANSNSGGPFSVSWSDTGIHILSMWASTAIGCATPPVFDTVMVHGLPDATIKAPAKSAVCIQDTVTLSAMYDRYNYTYAWSPAHFFSYRLEQLSNNNSTIQGLIDYPGYVILTVTDPFGCTATDSLYMDPKPCCEVLFPNAFTPNGDSHNDVFRPIFKGYHNFHQFRIVNRWGQTVFESANSDISWDGTFDGVPQDMDVYYYYLKYDCGGATMEAKGDVTLVR